MQTFGFSYDVRKADIDEKAIRHEEPSELVMQLAHAKADVLLPLIRSDLNSAAPSSSDPDGGADADGASTSAPAPGGADSSSILRQQQQQQQQPGAATCFLITCDQVVVHEGRILEKPEGPEEAREFIRGYARSPAQTVGSILVTRVGPGAAGGSSSSGTGDAEADNGDVRIGTIENCTILMDPLPEETAEKLIQEGEILWCAGGLMVEHPLVRPHVRGIEGGGEDSVMGLGREAVMRVLVEAAEA